MFKEVDRGKEGFPLILIGNANLTLESEVKTISLELRVQKNLTAHEGKIYSN